MNTLPIPKSEAADNDELDLIGVLDVLVEYRWTIVKIFLSCVLLATAFAFLFPPRYQADISVQVEDGSGMAAAQSLLGDVSSLFDYNSPTSAEQQIMASRLVVTSVVDELHSYIIVRPSRFPLIGDFISRFNDSIGKAGILGVGGWAWGTESADVVRFDVPRRVLDDSFSLTALADGRYRLAGWDLDAPVTGRVGEVETFTTSYGPVTLLVKSINANPGVKFKIVRKSRLDTINTMQNALDIEEKIKSSGVLIATLKGTDPIFVRDQLKAVGHYYVKQNLDRKSAEAAQSLEFLNTQVPILKQRLEAAEARYTRVREKEGSIDLSEEAKVVLQQIADATTRMLELKQKRDQLASRFTDTYPDVVALDAQIATLKAQQSAFNAQVTRMPNAQQDAMRLMLDVKINTDLYTALLNNVQQLELIKAGKTGTVRVVDSPVVPEDVAFPNRPVTIAVGALLGLLIGIGFAFVHNFLFAGVAEAVEIEAQTGLSVYATIPESKLQPQISHDHTTGLVNRKLLADGHPDEPAVESLRSLRTALEFAMLNARNNIVLFCGPTPGVGKSFVSANFGVLLAKSGKRVLVIDADLRRGYLHKHFGVKRERGLSEVVAGTIALDEAIQRELLPSLDFISTGTLPPNAAELLAHQRLQEVLEACSAKYDCVIIDSPPVLAVTDAAMLALYCGTVMLVARAVRTRGAELVECMKRFAQVGVSVTGALLNGIDPNSGRQAYGRKYGTYRYVQYTYGAAEATTLRSRMRRWIARLARRA
ncbi:Putative tyrosine-protein kinase EpsB [Paraburkholderia tropica]|uniref:polysaccharide biosynthesis tyrosine autokinase n=1 Tax=Paraburkholderia tropica TaxID=92647 RepID=UPI001CACF8E0|nr:polysaccharide biosynthesis tyrosine autokinase [Paraburkholderia tropica]CAG9238472.1 Putative tyrosine-protein kinase EpsB [Paraburkholderia tropica]